MAGSIVALRQEDVVILAALEGLVKRDGLAHELFFDLTKAIKTGLELEVVVSICLGDGRDNGDVVALRADVVSGRNDGDIDICGMSVSGLSLSLVDLTVLAANLRLWEDQLQGVGVVCVRNGVVENANGLEQVSSDARLSREVRGVCEDLLGLCLELHAGASIVLLLHCCLDTNNFVAVVEELVNVGVEHICTTVDGGKTSETLRKLSQTVQRIDVWGFAVTGHGIDVKTNALDGVVSGALLVDVIVSLVESHGVTDEVTGCGLQTELVVDVLHGAVLDIETYVGY